MSTRGRLALAFHCATITQQFHVQIYINRRHLESSDVLAGRGRKYA